VTVNGNRLVLREFYDSVLIRFTGEITLKSERVRRRLINALISNIESHFRRSGLDDIKITKSRVRIYLAFDAKITNPEDVQEILSSIPGIASFSFCKMMPIDFHALENAVAFIGSRILKTGSRFAVRTRRVGKHTFTSMDVQQRIGAYILDYFKDLELKVDLKNPEIIFFIEIRNNSIALFHEIFPGLGGLPADSKGKVTCCLGLTPHSWDVGLCLIKRGVNILPIIIHDPEKLNARSNRQGKPENINEDKILLNYMHDLLNKLGKNHVETWLIPIDDELQWLFKKFNLQLNNDDVSIFVESWISCRLAKEKIKEGFLSIKGISLNFRMGLTANNYEFALDDLSFLIKILSEDFLETVEQVPIYYPLLFKPFNDHQFKTTSNLQKIKCFDFLRNATVKHEVLSQLKRIFSSRKRIIFDLKTKSFREPI